MPAPTIIRRARFAVETFTPQRMIIIGDAMVRGMKDRIVRGMDANDQPAPALSSSYQLFKSRKYPPAERNMKKTGRSLRAIQVISVGPNRARVGMADQVAIQRFNYQQTRFWGVSPIDRRVFSDAVNRAIPQPVSAKQIP